MSLRRVIALGLWALLSVAGACHAEEQGPPLVIDGLVLQSSGASPGVSCTHDRQCQQPLRCLSTCVVPPALNGEGGIGAALVVNAGGAGARTVQVEVADDGFERSRGLMWRERMAPDWGMLFIFADESPRSFWMRNTYLPLDIVFIDHEGVIVSISEDAQPLLESPQHRSAGPAKYVLELNAGYAATHGIEAGQRVKFSGVPGSHDPELSR